MSLGGKMKHKYKLFKICLVFIILFFIYSLLEIFVIPNKQATVNNANNNVTDEEKNITTNTETKYVDDNISITLTTIRKYDTDIYIADVTINSIDYLKTAFANNTYGRNIKETTSDMAESNGAILAINGDYYGFRTKGFVLRNGTIYRSSSNNNEALVINKDGSFEIVDEDDTDLNKLKSEGATQVFSFGPALINNGNIMVTSSSEVSQSMTSNPRTAIGIIDDLHYIFVVSDGRTSKSNGLTLLELANVMKEYNCTIAYNLDGGGSTTMYFNGNVVNNPTDGHSSGERKVSDIIYVGY